MNDIQINVAVLENYEQSPAIKEFVEIGMDVRFTFKYLDSNKRMIKVFHLPTNGKSFGWNYIKPLIEQTSHVLGCSVEELKFEELIGLPFLLSTKEVKSSSGNNFINITGCVPLVSNMAGRLKLVLSGGGEVMSNAND